MKAVAVILALLTIFPCAAFAQAAFENTGSAPPVPGLPQEAVFLDGAQENDLYAEHYSYGEEMLTLTKKDQMPVQLFSEAAGFFDEEQDPAEAHSIVDELFPDALIISETAPVSTDEGFTPYTFFILSEQYAGSLSIAGNRIVSREFTFDEYISDGRLTCEGARKAIGFYRPDAVMLEIEFEEDDGLFIYEGEAELHGVEYEFEINAANGRLLEWERD